MIITSLFHLESGDPGILPLDAHSLCVAWQFFTRMKLQTFSNQLFIVRRLSPVSLFYSWFEVFVLELLTSILAMGVFIVKMNMQKIMKTPEL
jgi:hypothetical protein